MSQAGRLGLYLFTSLGLTRPSPGWTFAGNLGSNARMSKHYLDSLLTASVLCSLVTSCNGDVTTSETGSIGSRS